jgi:membrane protease YdiL (CAAX protease family)
MSKMLEVLFLTFSFALLYGALMIRTVNIWPLIALHTIDDIVM